MQEQVSALITMLYTDIEGSTHRWQRFPQIMHAVLARHDAILQTAISQHRGKIVVTTGDGVLAVFTSARDAVQAALAAQRALDAADWADVDDLKVRMGLHTGEAVESHGDYHSPALNRGARLMAAGHGGQILLSAATFELIRDDVPVGAVLRDLGEHRLKDLIRPEHIFQIAAEDDHREFAPLKTLDHHPNNLPMQATPLIGRETQAANLQALLRRADVRLVTLTGVGGVGKTRLSLQVAAELLEEYPDGVYFVALGSLDAAQLVLPAVALALGVKESGDQSLRDRVAAFVRNKQLLLVLDNFEHVLAAAPVVTELLQAAARLKVLVSSRIVLHLYGEREYPVPSLELPAPQKLPASLETVSQCAAVSLFIARAQLVKPDFAVTNETAPAVAEICSRLDGLPLAIELAAARVKMLPPQALLARLENRLKVLTGGARDLPARQQTIRGAIDWSYNLLDECEKDLFARLSVFAGGWTVEAAEAVWAAGEIPHWSCWTSSRRSWTRAWCGKTIADRTASRVSLCCRPCENTRPSGWWRAERGTMRAAHMPAIFWPCVEKAEPQPTGKEQVAWLARLEDEHDNLRAVLRWALESGEIALGLRTAGIVGHFWWRRGYLSEGRGWLEALLAAAGTEYDAGMASARAAALQQAARLADAQGDTARTMALAEEGRILCGALGDSRGAAGCLNLLGGAARRTGDYSRATALHEESLAICRALGDLRGTATSLNNLGIVTAEQGNYRRALELYEESLTLRRKLGDTWGIAVSLNNVGLAALDQGEYARAASLYAESLALLSGAGRQMGHRLRPG